MTVFDPGEKTSTKSDEMWRNYVLFLKVFEFFFLAFVVDLVEC